MLKLAGKEGVKWSVRCFDFIFILLLPAWTMCVGSAWEVPITTKSSGRMLMIYILLGGPRGR